MINSSLIFNKIHVNLTTYTFPKTLFPFDYKHDWMVFDQCEVVQRLSGWSSNGVAAVGSTDYGPGGVEDGTTVGRQLQSF